MNRWQKNVNLIAQRKNVNLGSKNVQIFKVSFMQKNKQTDKQTDKQTNRQTDEDLMARWSSENKRH